jgi:hypothetical protein
MFLNIFFMLKHIMLKLFIELMQTPSTFAFTNAIVKNVCMILVIFNLLFYFILMLVFHTWCGCDDIWYVCIKHERLGFYPFWCCSHSCIKLCMFKFPLRVSIVKWPPKNLPLVYNIISPLKKNAMKYGFFPHHDTNEFSILTISLIEIFKYMTELTVSILISKDKNK